MKYITCNIIKYILKLYNIIAYTYNITCIYVSLEIAASKAHSYSNKIFPIALIYFSKFLEGKIRRFRSYGELGLSRDNSRYATAIGVYQRSFQ